MTDGPKSRAKTRPPWRRFGRPHPQIANPARFPLVRRETPPPYSPPTNDPLGDRLGTPRYVPPDRDGLRR